MEQRATLAINSYFNKLQYSLNEALGHLKQATPGHKISRTELQRQALSQRLHSAINERLQTGQQRLAVACKSLDTISPLATLERGYAIVTKQANTTRYCMKQVAVQGGRANRGAPGPGAFAVYR